MNLYVISFGKDFWWSHLQCHPFFLSLWQVALPSQAECMRTTSFLAFLFRTLSTNCNQSAVPPRGMPFIPLALFSHRLFSTSNWQTNKLTFKWNVSINRKFFTHSHVFPLQFSTFSKLVCNGKQTWKANRKAEAEILRIRRVAREGRSSSSSRIRAMSREMGITRGRGSGPEVASLDTQICINKAWIFIHTTDFSPGLPSHTHISMSISLSPTGHLEKDSRPRPGAHISFRDEMQCALKNLPANNVYLRRGEWTKREEMTESTVKTWGRDQKIYRFLKIYAGKNF